jgi:PRD1 phage membrane DNA delivery
MGNRIFSELMIIATAIVSLAVVAVVVSKQADTANVVKAAGGALADDLKAAVSPLNSGTSLPPLIH